jgi:manganese/iron transport system permease protein
MDLLGTLPSPVDLVQLRSVRLALGELVLLAVAGGMLGAWIVLRRLAFFSHAVGTATFPGLVVAEAAGFSPRIAALSVALGYARTVERAGRSGRDPSDAATALGLVSALAAGVVLASDVFESGASVDRLLFGTAIGLDPGDLALAGITAALAGSATVLLGRAWSAAGFDPEGAPALGVGVTRADLLLLMLVAVAAVAALPAVGALLVASIFVVPAAIARLFARDIGALLRWSVAIAVLQGVAGLYASLWLDVPPGPAVAVLGAGAYTACAGALAVRHGRTPRPHPMAEGAG